MHIRFFRQDVTICILHHKTTFFCVYLQRVMCTLLICTANLKYSRDVAYNFLLSTFSLKSRGYVISIISSKINVTSASNTPACWTTWVRLNTSDQSWFTYIFCIYKHTCLEIMSSISEEVVLQYNRTYCVIYIVANILSYVLYVFLMSYT